MKRAARRALLAGALLIAAAWALNPRQAPPLYDGLQGPAEAYRYVNPPPGYQHTAAPTTGVGTVAVDAKGVSAAGFVNTGEQPPQAQFLIGQGALALPAGAKSVTITVKPVPPPAPIPASIGVLDGNVYEVSGTADVPGAVTLKPGGSQPTIVLRGPKATGNPTIALLTPGGSWTALHTVPLGGQAPDMDAANTSALGFFAMTLPGSGSGVIPSPQASGGPPASGGGSFPVAAVVAPLAILAVLAAVLIPVRVSRSRAATSRGSSRRGGGRRR